MTDPACSKLVEAGLRTIRDELLRFGKAMTAFVTSVSDNNTLIAKTFVSG